MKRRYLGRLVAVGLPLLLTSGLVQACGPSATAQTPPTGASTGGSGAQTSASRSQTSASGPAAAPAAGGPSEAEVKRAIEQAMDSSAKVMDKNSTARVTSWDTSIRTAPATQHTYPGLGTKTVFPVKVDFTVTVDHPTRIAVEHHKGGLYDFYKDSFGDWKYSLDEPNQVMNDLDKSK